MKNNRFRQAVVLKPCLNMINGITTANAGMPDFDLAVEQHNQYIKALISCGLTVTILDANENFPDSCFIEDIAICTPKMAVIANPGAESRNAEKYTIKPVLEEFYKTIYQIEFPGTLDGGDVMMVDNHYYIGISERTNANGADQLISFLTQNGMSGSKVPLNEMLHLKTGLSYLENNNLLITGEFVKNDEFKKFNPIFVSESEAYAANSLWINNTVLVPENYPETRKKIENLGYQVIEVNTSEFRKLDGGLSCLSLRF